MQEDFVAETSTVGLVLEIHGKKRQKKHVGDFIVVGFKN